jgi:hypothetical protein
MPLSNRRRSKLSPLAVGVSQTLVVVVQQKPRTYTGLSVRANEFTDQSSVITLAKYPRHEHDPTAKGESKPPA